MKRSFKTYLVVVVAAVSMTAPVAANAAENPLLVEMMLVNKAFRDIVSAVALEDSPAIVKAIEGLEASAAEKATAKAIKAGSIKTPKNPDKMREFKRMDDEFHDNMEALLKAAKADKQPKIRTFTKKLLDGCVKCHAQFRK